MLPCEVFLSHAHDDREIAERLAAVLRRHNIPLFYAPVNIVEAQQWQDEILSALRRCDWFVVVLSPAAVDSMWVRRETAYALKEQRFENKIAPLMYRPCDLKSLDWLRLFQIVDIQADLERGCRDLLRVWDVGYKQE
jgi:hypothetical protein